MKKEKLLEDDTNKLIGLYKLISVIIIIWIISIFGINYLYPKLENKALYGDSFGVINSLFSGLAFAGIIYTILLQRKELALQRQELKETRDELKRSADAQEKNELQQRKQSENLKKTAKLNALSTLIECYTATRSGNGFMGNSDIISDVEFKRYIQEIQRILKHK